MFVYIYKSVNLCKMNKFFKNSCRTCLNFLSENMISIYTIIDGSYTFADLIVACFSVQISKSDSLSKVLCQSCHDILLKIDNFKKLCIQADKAFRDILSCDDEASSDESSSDKNSVASDNITNDENEGVVANDEVDKTSPNIPSYENAEMVNSYSEEFKDNKDFDRNFTCETCNKTFKHSSSLTSHKRIHLVEKPTNVDSKEQADLEKKDGRTVKLTYPRSRKYLCEYCGKAFNVPSLLNRHIVCHTKDYLYKCSLCNKAFGRAPSLEIHMRIHTGERPYKCDRCSKEFYSKANFHRHMQLHTGDKRYECNICSRKFVRPSILKVHQQSHTGNYPSKYKCSICSKLFGHSNSLHIHMMIHSGERPHKCNICSKEFYSKANYNRHMQLHTGDKRYQCTICFRKFTRPSLLKVHLRSHKNL